MSRNGGSVPLPEWPEGGRHGPVQSYGFGPALSARRELIRCWGPWLPPPIGPPHAGPPSEPASHGTAHGCCLATMTVYFNNDTALYIIAFFFNRTKRLPPPVSSFIWTLFHHTFELDQLLVVLPPQCHLLPVLLQEVLVGLRHLTHSC